MTGKLQLRLGQRPDKPVMLYFSNQPVVAASIEQEQYTKLVDFKKSCKDRGLVNEYTTLGEFKENLLRHLTLTINDNEYFKKNTNQTDVSEIGTPEEMVKKDKWRFIDPGLTDEAKELLIEASKSPDGRILRLKTMRGLTIQSNNKNFVSEKDARLEAIWEDAINQLSRNGLIEDKGYKGEVFAVTRLGYEYADELKENANLLKAPSSEKQDDLEFEPASGTYISKEGKNRYCHKCLHSSSKRVPLQEQENGWYCSVCKEFYNNPNWNPPRDADNDYNPLSI